MNQDSLIGQGTKVLFDHLIKTTIHMTPSPELRRDIYEGLETVVDNHFEEKPAMRVWDLSSEQFTAYKILEKIGLIISREDAFHPTAKGVAIYDALDANGVKTKYF